jgi:hypothetical protein
MPFRTALVALSVFLTATSSLAQDHGSDSIDANDEVVSEVVRMLDAGVDDDVILSGSSGTGVAPPRCPRTT